MRVFLFLFALFLSVNISAQENWSYIQTGLTGEYDKPTDIIPITTNFNDKIMAFFPKNKSANAYYLNEKGEVTGEIIIDGFPKISMEFAGSYVFQNKYKLFYTNAQKTSYSSVLLDFGNNTYKLNKKEFKVEKERILSTFSDDEGFYIFSLIKNSNIFKLASYTSDGKTDIKIFDLENEEVINNFGKNTSIRKIIHTGTKKVRLGEPCPMDVAKAFNKVYFTGKDVFVTFDSIDKYTYVLKIDIASGNYTFDTFTHNGIVDDSSISIQSNSFLLEDYLFTINTTRQRLNLAIFNLNSKEVVSEYSVSKDETINFKNAPILLEKSNKKNPRQLEKTSQFLNKIIASKIGISAQKIDNTYVITFGSSKEVANSNNMAAIGGMLGGAIGGALFSSFSSYMYSKSTETTGVFDSDFNHVKGDVPQNEYDKIEDFTKNFKSTLIPTVFKYQDDFIWGSFSKASGFYRLVKFK